MRNLKTICFAAVLVPVLLSTAAAQESATMQRSTLTITAAAADERVRITAPSSVVQMHVEVYAASGEKLFDQEIRGGNIFDWHLQNGQAQRLAPGDYVCVVTAKSVSGRLTQKIGTVRVEEKSVSVQPAQALSALQAQTIGPVEENSSWTISGKDEAQTTTVIAHDGTDGQMIRGRGALSFRIGDFFRGIDTEQMRLSEEGNLGIGTSEPKAKLDVAGTIRAQSFLVVKPDKLKSQAASDLAQTADAATSVQPLISGGGNTGQLTKWTDGNVGQLGDSIITELASKIGVGTNAPSTNLHVFGSGGGPVGLRLENGGAGISAESRFRIVADAAIGDILAQSVAQGQTVQFQAQNNQGMFLNQTSNAPLAFQTNNLERMRILAGGNVGIATIAPGMKLEVAGSNGAPAISGNVAKGALRITGASNSVLDFGSTGASPFGNWLQSTDRTSLNTSYPLLLNPNGGNVGIGTLNPQQNLSVNGAMNVDQANVNGGSFTPGITFGSGSGEGIASNRTGGQNQFGLNFYTDFLNRLSITNGGNVGIGTTNPGAPLDVQVAAGQSLQFRQDSGLVPGINVKTTGGLAGIMRFRNNIEVWPSDDGTRAGKVSVWSTAPSPTIILDGQTGNLSLTGDASFRNLPGIQFAQGTNANTRIDGGSAVAVDSLTINAPASGFIFISADVEAYTESGGDHVFDFTLKNSGTNLVNSKSQNRTNTTSLGTIDGEVPIHLSWVFPVNAGSFNLNTSLYYDNFCNCGAAATVRSHNLTAIYLPKQY
jgi:hypothetical protein